MTMPDGALMVQAAAESASYRCFDRVIVGVLAEHDTRFQCVEALSRAFGKAVEVAVLDEDTQGPADTVARMIRRAGVEGAIAVKDSDSLFDPADPGDGGFISVCDVRAYPEMRSVGGKSFAVTAHDDLVVELIEKSVVSNLVCAGFYGFREAGEYLQCFETVRRESPQAEIFVSHVMNRAIAQGIVVHAKPVAKYVDLGTIDDWCRFVRQRGTMIVDLDGVVFRNQSHYFRPYWDDEEDPIAENVATLLDWQHRGAQLIFMTCRPQVHRGKTEAKLRALGFDPHALIMDCRHGRRFLINDHAASNPAPSAVGVSVERNSPSLGQHLFEWQRR